MRDGDDGDSLGCAPGQPTSHRPVAPLSGAVTGEPSFGLDPSDELVHAGEVRGGGVGNGYGAGGGLMFGL